ncbi:MAG: PQQ-dependent sugar dehydrogenase [Bryobacteraceae bacterium]
MSLMKQFTFTAAALCAASVVFAQGKAPACDANNGGITLPSGFCAFVAADGLGAGRHIAVNTNGDVYVALRGDREKGGGVAALRDTNGDGRFEMKENFGSASTTGVGIRNGYVYVATFNTVERYKLTPGQLKPAGAAEIVVKDLPGVRQHGDKGLTFDGKGSLYVNVGAPSNACQARDRQTKSPGQDPCPILEKNGGIWKFDENKLGQTQADGVKFATGLRQMPAITWHDDAVYIAMNNRDGMDTLWPGQFTAQENAERPAEPLYKAVQGSNFGWPYCFYDYGMKKFLTNPEYGGDGKTSDRCGNFTPPIAAFPAHWAPVDVMFYNGAQFPAKYKNGVFIVFHGSWNRSPMPQMGYNLTFQPLTNGKAQGAHEIFASGFPGKSPLMNPGDADYRPDGIAQAPDGSIYVSDSEKGRLWRVMYTGKR